MPDGFGGRTLGHCGGTTMPGTGGGFRGRPRPRRGEASIRLEDQVVLFLDVP